MIKSKINRFTAMLLSVIMILSSFSVLLVNAAKEEIHLALKETGIKWAKSVSFQDPYSNEYLTYTQGQEAVLLRTQEKGEKAYSLQPGADLVDPEDGSVPALSSDYTGAWYSLSDDQRTAIAKTMDLASTIETECSEDEVELAAQLLIWEFVCGYREASYRSFDFLSTYPIIDDRFAVAMFGSDYQNDNVKNPGVFNAYSQLQQELGEFEVMPSYASPLEGLASYQLTWDQGALKYQILLPDDNMVTKDCLFECQSKSNISFQKDIDCLIVSSPTMLTEPVTVRVNGRVMDNAQVSVYGNANKKFQSVITHSGKTKVTESYFTLLPAEAMGSLKVITQYESPASKDNKINQNVSKTAVENTKYYLYNGGYGIEATDNGDGTYTYVTNTSTKGTPFIPHKIGDEYSFSIDLPVGEYRIDSDYEKSGYRDDSNKDIWVDVKKDQQTTQTFTKELHQIIISKGFVKSDAVTDEELQNVVLKVKQTDTHTLESRYIKVISLGQSNYQYVLNENDDLYKDQTITENLTFSDIRNNEYNWLSDWITIYGVPVESEAGYSYRYNIEEVEGGENYDVKYYNEYYDGIEYTDEGSTNPLDLATTFKQYEGYPAQSIVFFVSNVEKKNAVLDVDFSLKVREPNGKYHDFTGETGITPEYVYDHAGVRLEYVQGSAFDMSSELGKYHYITADFDPENNCYVYTGVVNSLVDAPVFHITNTSDHSITIKGLPAGGYDIRGVAEDEILNYSFKASSISRQSVVNGQNKVHLDLVKQGFSSIEITSNFKDYRITDKTKQYLRYTVKDDEGKEVKVVCQDPEYGVYRLANDEDTDAVSEMKFGTLDNKKISLINPVLKQKYTITQTFSDEAFEDIPDMKASEVFVNKAVPSTMDQAQTEPVELTPDRMSFVKTVNNARSIETVRFYYGLREGNLVIRRTSDLGAVNASYDIGNGTQLVTRVNALLKLDNNTVITSEGTPLPIVEYNNQTEKFQKIQYTADETFDNAMKNAVLDGEKRKQFNMIPNQDTVLEFVNNANRGTIKATFMGQNKCVDETPQPIAYAEIVCEDTSSIAGRFHKTLTTNEKGEVCFEDLPLAVVRPNGTLAFASYKIEIKSGADKYDDKVSELAVFNKPECEMNFLLSRKMGRIYLTLASSGDFGGDLKGAEFTLFNDVNDNWDYDEGIDTLATGYVKDGDGYKAVHTLQHHTDQGSAVYEMDMVPSGSYVLVETKYPEGYNYGAITTAFRIHKDGQVIHPYQSYAGSPVQIGNGSEDRRYDHNSGWAQEGEMLEAVDIIYYIYNRSFSRQVFFSKVDSETHEKLPNAVFALYKDIDDDHILNKEIDDYQGLLSSDDGDYEFNLNYGTYFIYEDTAPVGYQKNNNIYSVDILEDTINVEGPPILRSVRAIQTRTMTADTSTDDTSRILVNNGEIPNDRIKGGITVFKIDTITKEKLSGAEFTVYTDVDEDGAITDVDTVYGKTKYDASAQKYYLNDIPYGYYMLKETKAPEGHKMSDAAYPFCIMDGNANITITDKGATGIQNMPVQAYVKVLKVDSTDNNKKLSGAEFTLYDKSGKAIAAAVSGKDGVADFGKIYYGSYTVKETKAPEGYILDDTPFTMKVVEENKTYTHTHPNTPSEGTCIIRKTAEDGIVKNVTFNISGTTNAGAKVDQTLSTDKDGQITAKLSAGTYTLKEVRVPERYVVPAEQTIEIHAGESIRINFQNTLKQVELDDKGTIEIVKTADDNVVSNVSFKVSGMATNGTTVEYNVTTDETGKAVIQDVPVGTYKVQEIKTADRYAAQPDQQVEVKVDAVSTVKFVNTLKKSSVQIVKVDSDDTDTRLSDAEFAIYDTEGQSVGVMTETDKGVYVYDGLTYGEYTVKETKAPKGYVADTKSYPISVTEDGKTITIETIEGKGFGNTAEKGSIAIRKTSYDDEVAGFSFQIVSDNYNQTFTTDENGDILVNDLIPGEYTIAEVLDEKSAQYLIPENITVTVKSGEVTNVDRFNDEKEYEEPVVWFEISKVDAVSKEPIADCYFAIKDASGVVLTTVVTDKTGKARVQMPYGEYLYQEIEAPEGYVVDPQDYGFVIDGQQDLVQVTVSNTGTGSIKIIKQDEVTEKTLPDCQITILDENKNVIFQGVTDKNGEIVFSLTYGTYYYQETKAPEGYILDDTLHEFSITENGKTVVTVLTNKQKPTVPVPEDKPTPEPIPTKDPVPEYKDVPKTSDDTNIPAILLVSLISAMAIALFTRKSKKTD